MNPADIRILFQDVDGCLNPADGQHFGAEPDWEPSEEQVAMLRKISDAVDASPLEHWVINTGRHRILFDRIAQHLPTPKLRYFLFEHACVLYDRVEDRNLDLHVIATEVKLIDLAARYANLETIRKLMAWYDSVGKPKLEAIYQVAMPRLDKLANLSFEIPEGVDGHQLLEQVEADIRADFSAEDSECLEFCRSDRFIDILPGVHKLDGLELVCAYLKIPTEQALAMGDYLNDLSIFEKFPQVICPANAHPQIIELTRAKGEGGLVSEKAYGAALLDFLERAGMAEA